VTDSFDDNLEELRRERMAQRGRPLTPKEYWQIRDSLLIGWGAPVAGDRAAKTTAVAT
jgi:hypothetical protein